MARVVLEHVRKVYENGFVAVHDATFTVEDGEFMVLVGPSGCGKSTTLRMIAGLEEVTEGAIYIGDRLVNDVPPRDRDIAMVFQSYALYPHMTVYENMAFGLRLRKFPREEIDRRVQEAARILGLEDLLDRKPRQLSGGQRQRVALGRAIVRKPQVFLFDEPLSNLDAKLRVQMRAELLKLHRRLEATMIYVTHDQIEAMTMGDRIVVLRDGHIQQMDTPLDIYNHPANLFVARFIGSPPMNTVRGEILEDGQQLVFVSTDRAIRLPAPEKQRKLLLSYVKRPIMLGVRPEDIYLEGYVYTRHTTAPLSLVLDIVEPLGSEYILHLCSPDYLLLAKVAPVELPEVGQTVQLAVDIEKLHFFDPETEEALGMREMVLQS